MSKDDSLRTAMRTAIAQDTDSKMRAAFLKLHDGTKAITTEGREAYIQTLVAFSRFAKTCGLDPAWERLKELAARLTDLDNGISHKLLEPRRRVAVVVLMTLKLGTSALGLWP